MEVFALSFILTGVLVPVLVHYLWPNFLDEIFVDPPRPPYRMRTAEIDQDIIVREIVKEMGGKQGPREPQLVERKLVRAYRRRGFGVVCTDDGRECVYESPGLATKVLVAKKEKAGS